MTDGSQFAAPSAMVQARRPRQPVAGCDRGSCMTTEPQTEALIEAAQTGDATALERLIELHQAQLYRFSMRMCRAPEDAEDVLQETLLSLARGVRGFRGGSSLSTWLYTVARNHCIRKRRRPAGAGEEHPLDTQTAGGSVELPDRARSPEAEVAGREVEAALERAIAALEPSYREVLVLRDIEGLSAPEVATVLGIGLPAVKSRLHRARLAVREAVAPALGMGGPAAAGNGSCPDILTLFSRHLEEEISGEVCKAMERHLAQCPRCTSACDSLRKTLSLCHVQGAEGAVPLRVQQAVKVAIEGFLQGAKQG